MGKMFCQRLICRAVKVIKRQPFRKLGIWFLLSPKGHLPCSKEGARDWTGGTTVPSYSSATSKGIRPSCTPSCSHPAHSIFHLGPSVAVKIQWLCLAKTRAPVSLDLGERRWLFPSHSQGKGLPQHRCVLCRMAQHEKEHYISVRRRYRQQQSLAVLQHTRLNMRTKCSNHSCNIWHLRWIQAKQKQANKQINKKQIKANWPGKTPLLVGMHFADFMDMDRKASLDSLAQHTK